MKHLAFALLASFTLVLAVFHYAEKPHLSAFYVCNVLTAAALLFLTWHLSRKA